MSILSLAAKFDSQLLKTSKKRSNNVSIGGAGTAAGFAVGGGGDGISKSNSSIGKNKPVKHKSPFVYSHSVFLPKLPVKFFEKPVIKESHYIGGFFIRPHHDLQVNPF